jgi:hypothetical protein
MTTFYIIVFIELMNTIVFRDIPIIEQKIDASTFLLIGIYTLILNLVLASKVATPSFLYQYKDCGRWELIGVIRQ